MSERLAEAAENGNLQKVKRYLDEGDDIHYQDDYALRWAAFYDHLEVVELLLDRGADIYAGENNALRYAAYNGHLKIVRLLLDNGADKSAKNYEALKWAKLHNHKEVIDLLENYFPSGKQNSQNIQDKNLKIYNTDGRLACYKCGNKLKQVIGFTSSNLNYCPNCEE